MEMLWLSVADGLESGNLGICNPQKMKILRLKIRSAQNVGYKEKLWRLFVAICLRFFFSFCFFFVWGRGVRMVWVSGWVDVTMGHYSFHSFLGGG